MKIRRKEKTRIILSWISLLLVVCILAIFVFFSVKPLVFTYAKNSAKKIMLNAANKAVLNILEEYDITYDGIAHIIRDESNAVKSIEIDINQINTLKSAVSNEMANILSNKEFYDLRIPIGTLIGNEYTIGIGPKIKFRMQFTQTAVVDFKSNFMAAGMNQVLHQILITIDISANILMIGCTEGFSVSTTVIAAQTVIVGEVPDSFTNVEEHPGDDIADEIFNYADVH